MKIAITDACIFIDLIDLQLIYSFFDLELDIHTSLDVFYELNPRQQEVLKDFEVAGRLTVHNLSHEDRLVIIEMRYPNSVSMNDKTVLYLADKIGAMVLSSDKAVRHNAKIRKIEYHGILWIFDRLVEASLLSCKDASVKLKTLVMTNIIYQNNAELIREMYSRLNKWMEKK